MTDERLDVLDAELQELLEADRDIPPVESSIRARLWARLSDDGQSDWRAPAEPPRSEAVSSRHQPAGWWLHGAVTVACAAAAVAAVWAWPSSSRHRVASPQERGRDAEQVAGAARPLVDGSVAPVGTELRLVAITPPPPAMGPLLGRVGEDRERGAADGIEVETESWLIHGRGTVELSWHLAATDPEPPCDHGILLLDADTSCGRTGEDLLNDYLSAVYGDDPIAAIQESLPTVARDPRYRDAPTRWRTFWLGLDGAGFTAPAISIGQWPALPELNAVIVKLNRDEQFAVTDFARRRDGRQAAVVAGGAVVWAPVVVAMTAEGDLALNPGGRTPDERRAALDRLVWALVDAAELPEPE